MKIETCITFYKWLFASSLHIHRDALQSHKYNASLWQLDSFTTYFYHSTQVFMQCHFLVIIYLVSLLDSLWNPVIGGNSFRQSVKTFLFATYWYV